jgi:hypothetical protein
MTAGSPQQAGGPRPFLIMAALIACTAAGCVAGGLLATAACQAITGAPFDFHRLPLSQILLTFALMVALVTAGGAAGAIFWLVVMSGLCEREFLEATMRRYMGFRFRGWKRLLHWAYRHGRKAGR